MNVAKKQVAHREESGGWERGGGKITTEPACTMAQRKRKQEFNMFSFLVLLCNLLFVYFLKKGEGTQRKHDSRKEKVGGLCEGGFFVVLIFYVSFLQSG